MILKARMGVDRGLETDPKLCLEYLKSKKGDEFGANKKLTLQVENITMEKALALPPEELDKLARGE